MESIGDARSFLSAAREVALTKPIIVIKAGRTEAAAKAAASHTGSLAGSDEVLDAAFRRVGVLRVNSISQVFDMAEVLAKQPRPRGPQAGDRDQRRRARRPGHRRADRKPRRARRALQPRRSRHSTASCRPPGATTIPIDILGDADAERYARTLAIDDPGPQHRRPPGDPDSPGDERPDRRPPGSSRPYAKVPGKPVLASWMGGAAVEPGEQILDHAGIPTFAYPDTAAQIFTLMWRSYYNLQALYETPSLPTRRETDAQRP